MPGNHSDWPATAIPLGAVMFVERLNRSYGALHEESNGLDSWHERLVSLDEICPACNPHLMLRSVKLLISCTMQVIIAIFALSVSYVRVSTNPIATDSEHHS